MKQIALGVTAVLLAAGCVTASGCTKPGGDASTSNRLGESFSAEMTMTLEDMTATGTIYRLGDGIWQASFDEPASLAGVVLDFTQGDVTASYKGLAFSVPQSAMPAKSVLSNLILAVDALAQEERIAGTESDGGVAVSGELEGSPYVLTLTKDGQLSAFEMDGLDASLTFAGVQAGDVPVATQTTAS